MDIATLSSRGFRLTLSLALALGLMLSLAVVAQAQTSAKDGQYVSPTDSGEDAINSAFTNSGSSSLTGAAGSSGGAGLSGSVGIVGSVTDSGSSSIAVLPSTGGALLPFVALGIFALSATGLVVIRRFNVQQ